MTPPTTPAQPTPPDVRALRSAAAVRQRCTTLYRAALADELEHVTVDESAWDRVLSEVAGQVLRSYPSPPIPVHGRLNHLRGEGWDLAADLLTSGGHDLVDAVVISVLMDAGAGPGWAYTDAAVGRLARSEGLAVAAHRMVQSGALADDGRPFGVDATALAALDDAVVARAFQVADGNPLVGLAGRADLLRSLGGILRRRDATSLGRLLHDDLLDGCVDVGAEEVLGWLLDVLAELWPGRITVHDHNLGDTWRHPLAGGEGATAGLVPFHKLSQWLTYSLVEPLQHLGWPVRDLSALTGLAEYRNGGMLIELGLVGVRGGLPADPLAPAHPMVVEWRAVTVAALDHITAHVDAHLPRDRRGIGMGELLEAGTWPLGRRLAYGRDPAGAPPLAIDSDGTVF